MKLLRILALTLLVGLMSACGRKASQARVPTLDEAGPSVTNAFNGAPPELQLQAGMAIAAARGGDLVGSYAQLQALSRRPDLNAAQRRAAVESEMAVMAELREAATNGNPAAEAAVQHFRMSK